jgi:CubicO group peptidase (beta-lactamase class C family)
MRHGKICAEGWWAPYAPGIRHGLQSHTKTYAATAVGIAYTEGILKLDDKIIDIFQEEAPKKPSDNLMKLTVKDVLCMGCGMDEMPRPSKDWIKEFLATTVVHTPGTVFMYNSMGSTLLGAIVKKKTGLGLQDYLKPRLYDKIGIDAENLRWFYMPDGMEVGGGGLFATTEDNLRLMKLYADGGVWEGERILAKDYVKLATTLQNESATEEAVNPPAKDNFVGYGFQIWMCRPQGVYRADGAMGQFTIVVPDKDMIIAITENASGAHWAQQTLDIIWEFLKDIPDESNVSENKEASNALARRMRSLALPAPAYAPYSLMANKISGNYYKVTDEDFYFDNAGVAMMMTGMDRPSGIKELGFCFSLDSCTLKYKKDNAKFGIIAALDGSRRYNTIGVETVSKALVSAAWISENTLEMTFRWIETCNERKYTFSFKNNELEIETEESTIFGLNKYKYKAVLMD